MVAFIEACRDQFGVEPVCRALRQAGVAISPSGYYAARGRPPPARAVRDAALEKQILRVYKDSGERYGAWKVWDQLNREGIAAARCTVERLMRQLGLRGVRRGGWKKPRTTVPDPSQDRPADLVNRDFAPDAPDRLWVVDFTFVATRAGTAYTAFVIDAFSRLIAGWRTAASHSTDLVLDALVMAVTYRARQGVKVAGLIHHSDAGSEYLSIRYGAELAASGIAPSVGTAGDSYDNALAESIIGLYKTEVTGHLGPWETPARVEAATSEWASWYNTARVMRRTRGRPPGEYEQAWRDGTLGQVPARGPGSRPRRPPEGGGDGRRSLPRRAPPAPAGAPPRTPALLRDAPAGHDGCGGRRASPRRPRDGCHGTPAQVKGASGVAGDDAEASPLTSPGNPRRNAGCPTRRCPPPGAAWQAQPGHQAGQLDSAAGQMFDKQKRKNDQTVVPPGGGTVEDNGPPRQEHLGRIESPPNSGCSTACSRGDELGHEVVRARGSELESGFAFGVVRQLFERRLAGAGRGEREALLAGPAAAARPLLSGELAAQPAGDSSFAVLHGLYWLVVNLAARRPLLIAVDDTQWADEPSLRWLAYLGSVNLTV